MSDDRFNGRRARARNRRRWYATPLFLKAVIAVAKALTKLFEIFSNS